MAKIELLYRLLVHNKDGKLVRKTRWKKSRSFVLQFLQHIDACFNHAFSANGVTVKIRDTSNVLQDIQVTAIWYSHQVMAVFAPDNSDSYGIQVGSGTTPPTNTDYCLETLIVHGVGAGQLDYGAHSRTEAGVVGANVDFIISRTFYNGSGATVTVNEIGVVCTMAAVSWFFLLIRDVLPAGVDVLNLQTLTVQYTLRTTV